MGCPVNKVIRCEAGARWLLDPNKIYEMVSAVVEAVEKPVTCKMRIGWDEDHIYAVENAKAAERAGASAIAMHGRTRVQMYEGKANWKVIKKVKEAVSIPVIGNGDVTSPELAKKMLDETGVDAVMIGRAAQGNPWMIYRTVHYLKTGELLDEPDLKEKIDVLTLHMDRLIDLKGEKTALMEMRKHASWYLRNVRGGGKIRQSLKEVSTREELVSMLQEFLKETSTRENKLNKEILV